MKTFLLNALDTVLLASLLGAILFGSVLAYTFLFDLLGIGD